MFSANYKKDIEDSRTKRCDIMKQIHSLSEELELSLIKMKGQSFYVLDFSEMRSFPSGKWIDVNDKTKTMKIQETQNELVFRCQMIGGGGFGWHSHSDCTEEITVLQGTLKNIKTGRTYKKNDKVVFGKGVDHVPTALEKTEIEVTFTR